MTCQHERPRPVRVWFVPVGPSDILLVEGLKRHLCDWEQRRVDRLRMEADKVRYILAHTLVRAALSEMHPVAPADWRLDQSVEGKPFVSAPGGAKGVQFSLSHTRGMVGCAVSRTPVGLDLEPLDRDLDVDGLLPHVMGPQEIRRCSEHPCEDQVRRFLSYWTLKEALAKGLGVGMSAPFPNLEFELGDGDTANIMALPASLGDASRWKVRLLDFAGTHVGAVAVNSEPGEAIELCVSRLESEALMNAFG